MTGPYDSIIGDDKNIILEALTTQMPKRFEVAEPREVALCGALITVNPTDGRAEAIRRVRIEL
jgi:calcineurin-like phosphoesterase